MRFISPSPSFPIPGMFRSTTNSGMARLLDFSFLLVPLQGPGSLADDWIARCAIDRSAPESCAGGAGHARPQSQRTERGEVAGRRFGGPEKRQGEEKVSGEEKKPFRRSRFLSPQRRLLL